MWHMTQKGGETFFQNFSYQAFTVWDKECHGDSEHKGWPTELINSFKNYEGVSRNAMATPSLKTCLLNMYLKWLYTNTKMLEER